MDTTAPTGPGAGVPTPDTATPGQRRAGIGLILLSSTSNQVGAALGALAFPIVGPVGVVAVRQLTTAAVLLPLIRPRPGGLTRWQWLPVLGLAFVFSIMNLSLYSAVERIGLGLAVTLEFLGPLAVAVIASRRPIDLGCAVLAAIGVVVLLRPGPSTDLFGIGLALVAAAAWAGYILLSRSLGRRFDGSQGIALASGVAAIIWLPVAVVWFLAHPPTLEAVLLIIACGVLASVLPQLADLAALRRVRTGIFATLTSLYPVWAALSGWVILTQALDGYAWTGIGLIVLSNVLVTVRGVRVLPPNLHRPSRRHLPRRPGS